MADKSHMTPESELSEMAKDTAQKLLNHYVRVQGLMTSQVRTQLFKQIFISPEKANYIMSVFNRLSVYTFYMLLKVNYLYVM